MVNLEDSQSCDALKSMKELPVSTLKLTSLA